MSASKHPHTKLLLVLLNVNVCLSSQVRLSLIQIPMHAAEHYILHSVAEKSPLDTYPVIRDPDGRIYVRDKGSHILAGGFEEVSKPAFEVMGWLSYIHDDTCM